MIAELQAERQCLDEAIGALERLVAGEARHRGRPPRWLRNNSNDDSPGGEESNDEETPSKPKRI
jgi:hypothetical protein